MKHFSVKRPMALGFQCVYRLAPDHRPGDAPQLLTDRYIFTQPNGLCFSPCERCMWINDTAQAIIRIHPHVRCQLRWPSDQRPDLHLRYQRERTRRCPRWHESRSQRQRLRHGAAYGSTTLMASSSARLPFHRWLPTCTGVETTGRHSIFVLVRQPMQ